MIYFITQGYVKTITFKKSKGNFRQNLKVWKLSEGWVQGSTMKEVLEVVAEDENVYYNWV